METTMPRLVQNTPFGVPIVAPWPRRCTSTKLTDGTEYIAEFDDHSTNAIRHIMIRPDGTRTSW